MRKVSRPVLRGAGGGDTLMPTQHFAGVQNLNLSDVVGIKVANPHRLAQMQIPPQTSFWTLWSVMMDKNCVE